MLRFPLALSVVMRWVLVASNRGPSLLSIVVVVTCSCTVKSGVTIAALGAFSLMAGRAS